MEKFQSDQENQRDSVTEQFNNLSGKKKIEEILKLFQSDAARERFINLCDIYIKVGEGYLTHFAGKTILLVGLIRPQNGRKLITKL